MQFYISLCVLSSVKLMMTTLGSKHVAIKTTKMKLCFRFLLIN